MGMRLWDTEIQYVIGLLTAKMSENYTAFAIYFCQRDLHLICECVQTHDFFL